MSRGKKDEEEKIPHLRLGNVEGGLEVGQTLWFFLEALCAQTNLFWREMEIINMYTET